jgi:hypothetical protein
MSVLGKIGNIEFQSNDPDSRLAAFFNGKKIATMNSLSDTKSTNKFVMWRDGNDFGHRILNAETGEVDPSGYEYIKGDYDNFGLIDKDSNICIFTNRYTDILYPPIHTDLTVTNASSNQLAMVGRWFKLLGQVYDIETGKRVDLDGGYARAFCGSPSGICISVTAPDKTSGLYSLAKGKWLITGQEDLPQTKDTHITVSGKVNKNWDFDGKNLPDGEMSQKVDDDFLIFKKGRLKSIYSVKLNKVLGSGFTSFEISKRLVYPKKEDGSTGIISREFGDWLLQPEYKIFGTISKSPWIEKIQHVKEGWTAFYNISDSKFESEKFMIKFPPDLDWRLGVVYYVSPDSNGFAVIDGNKYSLRLATKRLIINKNVIWGWTSQRHNGVDQSSLYDIRTDNTIVVGGGSDIYTSSGDASVTIFGVSMSFGKNGQLVGDRHKVIENILTRGVR